MGLKMWQRLDARDGVGPLGRGAHKNRKDKRVRLKNGGGRMMYVPENWKIYRNLWEGYSINQCADKKPMIHTNGVREENEMKRLCTKVWVWLRNRDRLVNRFVNIHSPLCPTLWHRVYITVPLNLGLVTHLLFFLGNKYFIYFKLIFSIFQL